MFLWFYLTFCFINLVVLGWITYRDYSNGEDTTLGWLLWYAFLTVLSLVGTLLIITAFSCSFIEEHHDDVIIKGKKKTNNRK